MDIPIGAVIIGFALARLGGNVGVIDALAFGVALAFGAVLLYCFWLVLATGSFWVVRMWFLPELFEGIFQTGRLPDRHLPGLVALRDHVPRADRVRDHRARRGGDLAARLADAPLRGTLHRSRIRALALVLALRAAALHRGIGMTSDAAQTWHYGLVAR